MRMRPSSIACLSILTLLTAAPVFAQQQPAGLDDKIRHEHQGAPSSAPTQPAQQHEQLPSRAQPALQQPIEHHNREIQPSISITQQPAAPQPASPVTPQPVAPSGQQQWQGYDDRQERRQERRQEQEQGQPIYVPVCVPVDRVVSIGPCSVVCGSGNQQVLLTNGCGMNWATNQSCSMPACQTGYGVNSNQPVDAVVSLGGGAVQGNWYQGSSLLDPDSGASLQLTGNWQCSNILSLVSNYNGQYVCSFIPQ